jgi:SNF2 family DNA or RNA helicase
VLGDKKLNKIKADLPSKQSGRFSSNATLGMYLNIYHHHISYFINNIPVVICPAALIDQWQDEIARFKDLSVLVMTEPNQTMETAAGMLYNY